VIPGKLVKGMGGAMDLVSSVKRVAVVMTLMDKNGGFKLRKNTELPVTGPKCVSILITDQGVFEFTPEGLILKEISRDTTVEKIRSMTDAEFIVASDLGIMEDFSSKYDGGSAEDEDIFSADEDFHDPKERVYA
jgi:3-oxoacid CoA-transferase subunit B